MNSRDPYQSWLEKCRNVEVSSEFSKGILEQISLSEPKQHAPTLIQRWIEWVSLHPLIKAAILIVALAVSAARMLATLEIILSF
jgi:hypothetical protein